MGSPLNDITWEEYYETVAALARAAGEWAGIPVPIADQPMVIADGYRFKEVFDQTRRAGYQSCHTDDVDDDIELRNEWPSVSFKCAIRIWRQRQKFFVTYSRSNSGSMLLSTLGACRMWNPQSEVQAQIKLRGHITQWQYDCYFLTGMFLETSKRSNVTYLFRRLRPTVAVTFTAGLSGRGEGSARILATLCLHPIGYAADSWAGAMVPTDDVIAHLLMMRSDEHFFWRKANQHPAWMPASGL